MKSCVGFEVSLLGTSSFLKFSCRVLVSLGQGLACQVASAVLDLKFISSFDLLTSLDYVVYQLDYDCVHGTLLD